MYVQVRSLATGKSVTIPTSRTTMVRDLKKLVEKRFGVNPDSQRLIFCGKQLEDQYSLFDYGININDVIQLTSRTLENGFQNKIISKIDDNVENNASIANGLVASSSDTVEKDDFEEISEDSLYFKVGDYVDVRDTQHGSWFLGKLIKIKKNFDLEGKPNDPKSLVKNDGLVYVVAFVGCDDDKIEVQLQEIRPHGMEIVPFENLKANDRVLMNYNTDHPLERGYWFDVLVKQINSTKKSRTVIGDVYVGINNAIIRNCYLKFLDDIYKVKPYQLLAERTPEDDEIMQTQPAEMRANPLKCIECKDKSSKLCKECGCTICGGKDRENEQLLCDECDNPFHISCLNPPLKEVPKDDDWYCPSCKVDEGEIVEAGGKLKDSKKKTPASTSTSKRDWGKGMACVGRTKTCNKVPANHFGPIPGVEVGTTWLFRVQVSEAGIHRPPVAGIHGRDNQGAFSIVLSGGYEDDIDNGDEFMYTGSGGRDLSGNKRTALQSCDQELTRNNRALALNCNAKLNDIKGATAVHWKEGKPVRVVRNYKLHKHSKYAPECGNRYDGIYKVVKYYPEKGISGFIIWRYVLKRDDPTPAPWTAKGKKLLIKLGLDKIIYPENYITIDDDDGVIDADSKLMGSKRKSTKQDAHEIMKDNESNNNSTKINDKADNNSGKKLKILYELNKIEKLFIDADIANKKYWDDCKEMLKNGKKAFLDRIEETFLCICCQDIVFEPITLECFHNICKGCLKRSFKAEVYQCPSCRAELGKFHHMNINTNLSKTLTHFFPGYNVGR
ncbi:E3 ubiquitin-protein ligase UHRF1-like [Sipha flava]|uniref:RING-type E3 ubiquitin transferase n=1 Tax=Sipha flava TaxID=143950 RepID=A0A8B8GLC5_9HEMI|nr:E3 ubiquitin-protein ligase UHRF1-like [Sipha flava]